MTTITIQDIALCRELIGKIWCESNGHLDGDFSTMNLKKISDDPEIYDFTTWECSCPKPTWGDMLAITKDTLTEMINRYDNTTPSV